MYKNYSPELRAKIKTKGTEITVEFQQKGWIFWKKIERVLFVVEDYCSIDPDLDRIRGYHLNLRFSNGIENGIMEVWKPNHFNLEKSLQEHWARIVNNWAKTGYAKTIVSNAINP